VLNADQIRQLLAEYRSGGRIRLLAKAPKGAVLPRHSQKIHGDAPELLDTLLAEIDRLTAALAAAGPAK